MKEIVWLGPMGTDKVSLSAINLRDHLIRNLASKHDFRLYYPNEQSDAHNWLTDLLRKISSAAGVVCDVSGERCNIYFELGYAMAQNIPTILIAQKGTKVHIDLANLQRWSYFSFEDVTVRLEKWFQLLSHTEKEILVDPTRGLPHGFAILEGDGAHEYMYEQQSHRRPFTFELLEGLPLTLETIERTKSPIGELLRDIHRLQAASARQTNRPFHNGELLGYVSHTPRRDESGTAYGASIRCRKTDYFTFVATHYARAALEEARTLGLLKTNEAEILSRRIVEHSKTPEWPLARPLTATLLLVLDMGPERQVIFQRRNLTKNFHARYPLQATAAGMIHPARIVDQDGTSDLCPEIAFLHELCEEAGIGISRSDVRILGLVEELVHHEVGFVGFAHTTRAHLDAQKIPIDCFEAKSFKAVQLSPVTISQFLRDEAEHGRGLVPLALAALALLLTHEFGRRGMLEIFEAARK